MATEALKHYIVKPRIIDEHKAGNNISFCVFPREYVPGLLPPKVRVDGPDIPTSNKITTNLTTDIYKRGPGIEVVFFAETPGNYYVKVTVMGVHVPGSPFIIPVTKQGSVDPPIDPFACIIDCSDIGKCHLMPSSWVHFTLREAPVDIHPVCVVDPHGDLISLRTCKEDNRTFKVTFRAVMSGNYFISIVDSNGILRGANYTVVITDDGRFGCNNNKKPIL